jgi:hypothetical protein
MRATSSATSSGVPSLSQDGLGGQVVAGMHEVLDRRGHRLVHHLQPRRDDAGRDEGSDRVAGLAHIVEAGHQAARQPRLGHQLDGDLGDDRQHALAADDQRQQVQARRVQRLAAELDGLALGGEAAHAQDVVQRQAVLQAMHAAAVLGDVAADGAGDLAARVGRVVQAQRRGGLADGEVAHAALHAGRAGQRVDGQDLVELRQRQRDAQFMRHRAAGQARAGAARDDRHAQGVAGLEHRRHLRLGLRQRHGQRALAVGG